MILGGVVRAVVVSPGALGRRRRPAAAHRAIPILGVRRRGEATTQHLHTFLVREKARHEPDGAWSAEDEGDRESRYGVVINHGCSSPSVVPRCGVLSQLRLAGLNVSKPLGRPPRTQ